VRRMTAQTTALIGLLCEHALAAATAGRMRVPGLSRQSSYRIRLVVADHDELERRNRVLPPWVVSPVQLSGDFLAQVGLALPVLSPHAGLLILCEREND